MPASGKTTSTNALHSDAVKGIITFDGVSGPKWHATKVYLQVGPRPSYALAVIPLVALHETAPTIACVAGGPLQDIKHGTRAEIDLDCNSEGVQYFSGSVVEIHPNILKDHAIIEIWDDRYLMLGLIFSGSFWMSGPYESDIGYRQGWRAHFNPNNRPNGILRTGGSKVMVFCNPFYGLADGVQPPEEASVDYATYWTLDWALHYAHWAFDSFAAGLARAAFPWYPDLPSTLHWPSGWTSAIQGLEGRLKRKARESVIDGKNLVTVVSEFLEQAGPYGLYLEHAPGKNIVSVGATKWDTKFFPEGSGVDLRRGSLADGYDVVTDGDVIESSKEFFTRFVTAGALTFIEIRVASNGYEGSDTTPANDGTLQWAWGDDLMEEARRWWESRYNAPECDSAPAVLDLWKEYPKLFGAWRLSDTLEFQAGTAEEGKPRAKVGRPILSHLLTTYLEALCNASAKDTWSVLAYARQHARRPVVVEYYDNSTSAWRIIPAADGLAVEADGTIWLTGARESGYTYTIAATQTDEDMACTAEPPTTKKVVEVNRFMPTKIRMTVAIPCDHRLLYDISGLMLNWAGDDRERVDFSRLKRFWYSDAGELYAKEYRIAAWPIPECVQTQTKDADGNYTGASGDTPQAEDRTGIDDSLALRDDSLAVRDHGMSKGRDYGRLNKSGWLSMPHVLPTFRPGVIVDQLGGHRVAAVVSAVELHLEKPQKTILHLGR